MRKRIVAIVMAIVLAVSYTGFAFADEESKLLSLSNLSNLMDAGVTKDQLVDSSYGRAALTVMLILDLMAAGVSTDDFSVADSSYIVPYDDEYYILLLSGYGSYSGKCWELLFTFDHSIGSYCLMDSPASLFADTLSDVGVKCWENSLSDIESVLNELSD